MAVAVFGYLTLISIDFYDFISPFPPYCKFRLRRNIKHERSCLTTLPDTSKYSALRCMWSNIVFRV